MPKENVKKATVIILTVIVIICSLLTLRILSSNIEKKPVFSELGKAGFSPISSASVGEQTIDGYYPISGLLSSSTRASRAGYKEKVKVDGLTVSFYVNNWSGGPIGFGFGDKVDSFPPDRGTFFNAHFRKAPGLDWDFLYYSKGFAFDESIAYKDTALTDQTHGIDGNRFYAFNHDETKSGNPSTIGVSLKFEKSGSVWKITTSPINGKGEIARYNQNYCYVSSSYIPDEAYIISWGEMQNSPIAYYKVEVGGSSTEPVTPDTPTSSTWLSRGEGNVQITNVDNGYTKINVNCNGSDFGKGANYQNDVPIDGLVLYMYTNNIGNAKFGIGFVDNALGYSPESSNRFNVVLKQTNYWNLVHFITNHDIDNGTKIAYKNSSCTETNYGIDGNQFYGFNKTNEFGLRLKFSKYNDSVWKVDTTLILGKDSNRNQSYTTYVPSEYIGSGNKYLSFWVMDATTDVYVKVSNGEYKEEALNDNWIKKGDGNVTLTETNNGVKFEMEREVAVISKEKFNVKNFEMTVNLDDINDGWWLIGFAKEQRLFNTDNEIDKEHDTGFFLLMSKFSPVCAKCKRSIGNEDFYRCPTSCLDGGGTYFCQNCVKSMQNGGKYDCYNCQSTLNFIKGYNLDVRVYTLENAPDKTNGEKITWNFEKGHRGDFEVKYTGNNQLKIRLFPDESGKYLQMEINGSILRNQRVRYKDDINGYMFDEDGKGYLIFQCWKENFNGKDTFEIKTINNKNVLTEDYYVEDPENLTYVFVEDEEDLSLGCQEVSNANKSELIGGSVICLLLSTIGIFLIKRKGGKSE